MIATKLLLAVMMICHAQLNVHVRNYRGFAAKLITFCTISSHVFIKTSVARPNTDDHINPLLWLDRIGNVVIKPSNVF